MDHSHCLNCGHEIDGNYCRNCGQKASTHRFTLKHLVMHDIVHGAFHLDKGFPYTIKQLFTRPGRSIREFIEGKRVGHFNAVTFLLLTIALNLFVQTATDYDLEKWMPKNAGSGWLGQLQFYQAKYMKEFYLVTIPLASLITYFLFRRSRLHYAEHLVLHTYKEGFTLLLVTICLLFLPLFHTFTASMLVLGIGALASNLWIIWYLIQVFRQDYKSKLLLILLILSFFVINIVATGSVMLLLLKIFFGLPAGAQ